MPGRAGSTRRQKECGRGWPLESEGLSSGAFSNIATPTGILVQEGTHAAARGRHGNDIGPVRGQYIMDKFWSLDSTTKAASDP